MYAGKNKVSLNSFEQRKLSKLLNLLRAGKDNVSLDVDGTLAQIHPILIDELNKRRGGTHFTVEDIDDYDFSKSKLKMEWDEFTPIYDHLWRVRREEMQPSIPEYLLARFREAFKTDLVTFRTKEQGEMLESWLQSKFPNTRFNDGMSTKIVPTMVKKAGLAYNLFIDDAPNVAEDVIGYLRAAKEQDKFAILISQPWNRKLHLENNENVLVVKDLASAMLVLLELKSIPEEEPLWLSQVASMGIVPGGAESAPA